MTFELRLLTVALAAFTVVELAIALLVPALASRPVTGRAATRARRLAMLRLLPARAGAVAGLLAAMAFATFEPRQDDEYRGWLIPALAGFGALLVAAAGWRWMLLAGVTRRLTREWLATAEPITLSGIDVPAFAVTSAFPIVAVVGLRRPKLVIARSVMDSCTSDELRAILAHEQGHLDRGDNLRRLMMSATPDILAWLPASDRHFAAWRQAAEEAADDDASRAGADGQLCLAAALVKVARLASGTQARQWLPTSALYCGENLDVRIRRLLEPRASGSTSIAGAATAARTRVTRSLVALAGLAVASMLALDNVHAVLEAAIHALP